MTFGVFNTATNRIIHDDNGNPHIYENRELADKVARECNERAKMEKPIFVVKPI